jgi:Ca2+-dependent lipid-binding protein
MQTLVFHIYDYDMLSKHDQIGVINLPFNDMDIGKPLRELRQIDAPPSLKSNQFGSICFSLRYAPNSRKITVTILEAKNLKKMDIGKFSDPYVKIELFKNRKRIEKRKTSIKCNTLTPYYNESYTFNNIQDEDLKKRVKDNKKIIVRLTSYFSLDIKH